MNQFEKLCKNLEAKIVNCYTDGITMEEAEKLAAEFLHGMLQVSAELKLADLDARMKKSGVKAVRAAIYLEGATKGDKKPSDVLLQATVDVDKIVQDEQTSYDAAEANKDDLERYYNIFREGHIYARGVAKGVFNG